MPTTDREICATAAPNYTREGKSRKLIIGRIRTTQQPCAEMVRRTHSEDILVEDETS
jgi:hypothetical protein